MAAGEDFQKAFLIRLNNLLKHWGSNSNSNSNSKNVRRINGLCSPIFQSTKSISSPRLFIGGLDSWIDEKGLKDAFEQYGRLTDVRIVSNRDSGKSQGFGFVTYTSPNAANSALLHMDGKELCGQRIKVSVAHPLRQRRRISFSGDAAYGFDESYLARNMSPMFL